MDELLTEYAERMYKSNSLHIREKPFTLSAGGLSRVYLDHRRFILSQSNLRFLLSVYDVLLGSFPIDAGLCVLDSVCSPIICGALAMHSGRDLVITREKPMAHGLTQQVWMGTVTTVVCVDDIITSGRLMGNAVSSLRAAGGIPLGAVAPIIRTDHDVGGPLGIQIHVLGSLRDAIARIASHLSERERALLVQEGL